MVGRRIKILRGQRQWTQAELAQRAGVARQTIISAESGRPLRQSALQRVATALGVDVEELMRAMNE